MARNTTNLVLKVWDGLMDRFSHVDLAANWDQLDIHDHTGSGKGKHIPNGGLATNAVDQTNIQDNAVVTSKILDANVIASKIADGNVTLSKLHSAVQNQFVPVGTVVPYAGTGDPIPGAWVLADGRLINATTFSTFMTSVGHAYNGGISPGNDGLGNPQVRIPDKRGRVSVGQDNMGTTAGAAGRITANPATGVTHAVARGGNGGAQIHSHTINDHTHGMAHTHGISLEAPTTDTQGSHSHGGITGTASGDGAVSVQTNNIGVPGFAHYHSISGDGGHSHTVTSHSHGGATLGASSGSTGSPTDRGMNSLSSLQPYELDNYIVRIA